MIKSTVDIADNAKFTIHKIDNGEVMLFAKEADLSREPGKTVIIHMTSEARKALIVALTGTL